MTEAAPTADVAALSDYERHAAQILPPGPLAYLTGGGADGLTRADNRSAWDGLRIRARVLRDLRGASTRLRLLGLELDHPILVAPMAYQRLFHPQGEEAMALGAAATGTLMVVSCQASQPIRQIAAAGQGPLWFQLYFQPDAADTVTLVRGAEAAGARALVVTVDAPVTGLRNCEHRAGFRLPEGIRAVMLDGMAQPGHSARPGQSPVFRGLMDHAPTWDHIAWLKARTALPVLLKGITCAEDASLAVSAGADGIIVSNHGGRGLDTLPATASVLPGIARAVAGAIPVLVDGGIRRGTDILKARALGADAVLVGTPLLSALAVAGAVGVAHALTILKTELELAMALSGARSWGEIGPELLWR